MGMDVYGYAPTQKEGEYFRNNIWWWHPLADYIELIAPDEAAGCAHWHSNDCDGLDEDQASALADKLQAEIDSGRCLRYAVSRGTVGNGGTTSAEANQTINAFMGALNQIAEDEDSKLETPTETDFPFSVDNVQEFVIFLRHCGGFEIC